MINEARRSGAGSCRRSHSRLAAPTARPPPAQPARTKSADAAPRHKLCLRAGHRRRPRGSFSAQSTQRGSRALSTGAANQYRQSGHCRFTMPGIGSHGSALIARVVASFSQPVRLFMACCVTRRPRAGTRASVGATPDGANPGACTRAAATLPTLAGLLRYVAARSFLVEQVDRSPQGAAPSRPPSRRLAVRLDLLNPIADGDFHVASRIHATSSAASPG